MRSVTASRRSLRQSYDWKIIIIYLMIVLIGWVNIYASIHTSDEVEMLSWVNRSGKQAVWILTALALAMMIMFWINGRLWEVGTIPLYSIVLVLLVAVIFLGAATKGSRSWFEFGPVKFQPAEISKISTSLMLAYVMSQSNFRLTRWRDFLKVMLVIGVPMLVIVAENETGSALVYVGFIFMLYREGLSGWLIFMGMLCILLFILTLTHSPFFSAMVLIWVFFACNIVNSQKWKPSLIMVAVGLILSFLPSILGWAAAEAGEGSWIAGIEPMTVLVWILGLSVAPLIWLGYKTKNKFIYWSVGAVIAGFLLIYSTEYVFYNVFQAHQQNRIAVLLGMKEDLAGAGYNVHQSMIAIGSGGLFGKGFLRGTQTTFGFVPEQSTDFIFCTIGEEWGFVGCIVVILLYVTLIMRIIHDAERSREAFTRIYGYCVACCLFMHLFINVGMTIGLMPVIGIPLPLISYGGSSLWAFTILIFIFVALYHEEKKYF